MKRLSRKPVVVYAASFLLMMIPSILLFRAAGSGSEPLIWFLLGLVVLGNLLVLIVR
jgi:hypothetical protein